MRILIVDDNTSLAATIGDYLSLHAYSVDYAADGQEALSLMARHEFDAVVLDIAMPRIDGLEVCTRLRQQGNATPILMLTARDTLEDKISGFDTGADDYLVKPFALEELGARLRALTSRGPRSDCGTLRVADLEINLNQRTAQRGDSALRLNRVQFELLKTLALASPNTVSREKLEYAIWRDEVPDSGALRTHIYRLRNIVDRDFERPLVHTVHSKGFRLSAE